MNLLDSIISGGARVVKSEHNVNNIAVEGTDVDRAIRSAIGGGWDEAEYGISRAEVQRRFDAANTPEKRAEVLADLRQRAIARAGLDTTGGKVRMFTDSEKGWWHRLGNLVTGAVNAAQARQFGGIDFTVSKLPYFKPVADLGDAAEGPTHAATDRAYYLVRDDTGATLCDYCGPDYEPIQHDQMTDFFDALVSEFGARYATAGSLYGGRDVFLQIYLPEQSFALFGGKDVNEAFATFKESHVQGTAGLVFPSVDRAVCGKTLRRAVYKDGDKGIRLRHTGNIKQRLDEARQAMGLAVEALDGAKGEAEVLARTTVNATHYFSDVLDAAVNITNIVTAADALKGPELLAAALGVTEERRRLEEKSFARKIERRESILEDILGRYESDRCQPRGTAYGAVQAVTESADHGLLNGRFKGTDDGKASRRAESILYGAADDIKQEAYRQALALTV